MYMYSCSSTFPRTASVRTGQPRVLRSSLCHGRASSINGLYHPHVTPAKTPSSPFVAFEACCVQRCRSDQLNSRLQQRPAPASVRSQSPSDPIRYRPNTITGQRRSNQLTTWEVKGGTRGAEKRKRKEKKPVSERGRD